MLKVHAFVLVSLVLNITEADLSFSGAGCYKSYVTSPMSVPVRRNVSSFAVIPKWLEQMATNVFVDLLLVIILVDCFLLKK